MRPSWEELIERVLDSDALEEVFKHVHGRGVGNSANGNKILQRLKASDYDCKKLFEVAHEITDRAARLDRSGPRQKQLKAIEDFHYQLLEQLFTVASVYLISGTMMGTFAITLRMGPIPHTTVQ
jgi:hypothetical protein